MIYVVCGIIKFENKIIVAQRSEKMSMPLKWEFPGGKMENGEDEIACIKREIKEELNIEIEVEQKLTNCIYDYTSFKINLIPFVVNYIGGEIKLLEHKDYKCLDKNDLVNLDWAEADLPILKEFLSIKL